MHPFSVLTLGIFVAGYITARWDLVTRLYELAIFAWDYGVVVSFPLASLYGDLCHANRCPAQTRAAKGFVLLTLVGLLIFVPVERLATREANLVRSPPIKTRRLHTDKLYLNSTLDRPASAYRPGSS
jgi:phosphatidylinositol glycan class Q protein